MGRSMAAALRRWPACLPAVSMALRIILVAYGEWQDAHLEVRYTDVDYLVFSDAAALAAAGRSPFERATYRYSPILAFLLLPNSLHPAWGKLLFSAADLLVGLFIGTILRLRGVPEDVRSWCVAVWLFNPFTFTIGTRGNCEPVVCAIVLWIIICLMNGVELYRQHSVLSEQQIGSDGKPVLTQLNSKYTSQLENGSTGTNKLPSWSYLLNLVNGRSIAFGLLSGSVFLLLTYLFFLFYGWDFLNEALLYHLTRTDPRHNFSIYFYYIYLHHQQGFSVLEKLVSFLPQLMVQLALISRFSRDLPFCLFTQTLAFVAFNKVMTAQYFMWFFCLLPLVLPWSRMQVRWRGLLCILVWMGAQLHWLMWAYQLEFKGKNVFLPLWTASLLFLAANTCVLLMLISHHSYTPLFSPASRPPQKVKNQ